MSNPRSNGLILILFGVLVLGGNTLDMLPREAFWAGLFAYPLGAYLFFKGSREAREHAERQAARERARRLAGAPAQEHARRQARHVVRPHAPPPIHEAGGRGGADAALPSELEQADPGEFRVSSDVSHPTPLRGAESLADQLEKLGRLQQQGVITKEELAIAKAKLLG